MVRSYVVPSSELPGYSNIYRHPNFKDGTQGSHRKNISTMYDLFKDMARKNPKTEFLGTRRFNNQTSAFDEYEWLTATEADHYVCDLGSGLDKIYSTYVSAAHGIAGQQPLGIYSCNRAEWLLAELSAFYSRRYSVGITDTASVELFEFCVNESGLQVIMCSIDKIPRMLERIEHTPGIKVIISMDKLDCSKPGIATQAFSVVSTNELKIKADSLGVVLMDMDQVVDIGRSSPTSPTVPKPSDICTVCYTVGTTGMPRGVVITHAAFAYATYATYLSLELQKTATYLSYLSLHLAAERHNIYALMHNKVRIGFSGNSSLRNVFEDMQILHPTVVFALPQLLNSAYIWSIATTTEASGVFGFLSRIGLSAKIANLRKGLGFKHAMWDKLVFKRIAAQFGGSLELLITGYSVLQPQIHDFFRAALSCAVVHRYCLTELAGGGIMQSYDDSTTGIVGVPQPGIEICLRSIPSLGYNVADLPCPRGMLLVRSESISLESVSENDNRASSMDRDWLATGDIAQFNTDGTFTIIDRLSNIATMSSGSHVALGHLESIYTSHPIVDTVIVSADDHEDELIAIVVPRAEKFVAWAHGIAPEGSKADLVDLCANKLIAAAVAEELNSLARSSGIPQTHKIDTVYLELKMSSLVTSDIFTETFSICRRSVADCYLPALNNFRKALDTGDAVTISPSCVSDITFIGRRAKH
ncbi:medium-chain fatty acid-CoA ligase faa2 [Coemansia sp. IMI 203386]|nr:medium-chain fatty acid-CoA ligase faa2 [Coemansia sp. IMI 203386]